MRTAPLESQSSPGQWIGGALRAIPGLLALLLALIIYNVGQLLVLAIRPASKRIFRAYNRRGADLWWRLFAVLVRSLHGIGVKITGDRLPERENAMLVPNHQQMPDICFLILLARQCRRAGDTKWFVKRSVRYVPFLGWGMLALDNLFVERSWNKDRESIERTFQRINRDRLPVWLILFAEGTRITPDKLVISNKLSVRKNRRQNKHVLFPRTKGFSASIIGLRGHLDAVYDVTIAYEKRAPSLWEFICGLTTTAHLNVRRFPVDSLPDGESELAEWLFDRYDEKDDLLERFYKTGELGSL